MSARHWSREQQMDLAVKVVDGNAGALDFVRGLTSESAEGWDLLERIDVEQHALKGSVLHARAKNAGTYLAMTDAVAPHAADLTFAGIARKLLA